ncbi:unannotated protein [freshwater metagenome]|uniref:Unannotated protein n=1 Tax=freshwater metagenome TaxID=449393 RepID=A0A6J7DA18_9ZZZZ
MVATVGCGVALGVGVAAVGVGVWLLVTVGVPVGVWIGSDFLEHPVATNARSIRTTTVRMRPLEQI